MDYSIRQASVKDAEGIALCQKEGWIFAHVNETVGITKDDILKHLGTDKEIAGRFSEYLKRRDTPYYIVEINGEIMGYSGCYKEGEYWTGAVYLRPPIIGRGIGGKLFKALLNDLPKGDCFLVKIATFNERSKRMFEKLGFKLLEEKDEYHLRNSDKSIPLIKMRKEV